MSDIPVKRNHMKIPWHNYVSTRNSQPITEASLSEKASLIGRTGMMLLSCGTGAWRVRSSMNTLSEALGITCSADIGLMSISYTCFDGESSFSHALSLTTTGVNTSRLNRLEHFVSDFPAEGIHMSGEALHSQLDEIERIHGLYSPAALGLASALACGAFTFLLGGGPLEMILAFAGAGIGNAIRCKLGKHHFTLFMCIAVSVSSLTHDYTRKGGIVHAEIMLPAHAPPEFADRSILWNSVEQIEKARDSQLAREIEAALPRELSGEQQLALVRAYVKDNFVDKGMCADFAIHDKGTGNPHVHIMLTLRPLKENGQGSLPFVLTTVILCCLLYIFFTRCTASFVTIGISQATTNRASQSQDFKPE